MTGGLDHIKEFDQWLNALVRRHQCAIYVHYSTINHRWYMEWDRQDKERKKRQE